MEMTCESALVPDAAPDTHFSLERIKMHFFLGNRMRFVVASGHLKLQQSFWLL